MRATLRVGVGLAEAVLGAGMLIAPPIVASLAGPLAPTAWMVHLAGGAVFSATLALLAYARTAPASIADVVGAVLGTWGRRTVLVVYLAGFTIGQAAIALAAGGFLVEAAGSGSRTAPALAVLGAGTVGAAAGVRLGDRARRSRLGVTALLAAVGCVWPELFGAAGLLPATGRHFAAAVFLLFFAGVGWESSARSAAGLSGPAAVLRAVALGAAAVSVVYLALAFVLGSGGPTGPAPGGWLRVAALAAALVLTLYCVTNIAAAARFVVALGGPERRWVGVAVGVAVGGVSALAVLIAAASGWGVAGLLVGPCVAAWAGYLLATVCAVRNGPMTIRVSGVVLITGLFVLPALALV